jgi:signal transduction histidine kinase
VEANCGDSPGTLASRDGRLWMPMRSALAVIDTKRVREDLEPPAVLLKRVMVDDRAVASYGGPVPVRGGIDLHNLQSELRLPPEHHRLSFDFTALGFAGPENIRFRYRLSGFDDAWVEAGGARSAGYSRLPAGDYRFHVQACNSDGVWNEEGAALAFTVMPFVWQTWWFQLLALGLFTSCTVIVARRISLRRIRTKLQSLEQQTALHKERVRIARDLHDDLGSCLTKIVVLNDLTLDYCAASEQASRSASQVSATAREVIKSLDETVWALNPRNDTLADLVDYIGQFAVDLLEAAGIRCRLDLPANVSPRALSAELRHNLFMVAKEALHNVVRHSGASEVRLRVAIAREHLELTIADNGKGLAERPESPGADGLRNMKQRMEEIGGRFRIESAPASGTSGTRVEATIPWQSATAAATAFASATARH